MYRPTTLMTALTLTTALIATAPAARAGDLAVEGYAGLTAPNSMFMTNEHLDFKSGQAYGLGVYYTGVAGWEFGADLMYSEADFDQPGPNRISSTSLMAVARKVFETAGPVDYYLGAGLGVIDVAWRSDGPWSVLEDSERVTGGQLSAGLRYELSPAASLFTEAKYQHAFGAARVTTSDVEAEFRRTTLATGLRYAF